MKRVVSLVEMQSSRDGAQQRYRARVELLKQSAVDVREGRRGRTVWKLVSEWFPTEHEAIAKRNLFAKSLYTRKEAVS